MKKKLPVLLIALASTMMPNFASAIAIDVESGFHIHGLQGGEPLDYPPSGEGVD